MPDPFGFFITICFIAAGLSIIPINEWLDARRARQRTRRRFQATRKER